MTSRTAVASPAARSNFLNDLETVFIQNVNNVSAMHVVCRSWVSFGSSSMKNYVY